MSAELLEWMGYVASAIIAISMFLSSIVRLRWVNLVGAALFMVYGVLIKAWPVALLNAVIVVTDIYYLLRIYSHVDMFELLEVPAHNPYLQRFLFYYNDDIVHYNPDFVYRPGPQTTCYLVMRNMVVVGVFIARINETSGIEVELDYVTPGYRDMKNGRFVYMWVAKKFMAQQHTHIWADGTNPMHVRYLRRMGFKLQPNGRYCMMLAELV
ncbi:MAG: YgjV family protein [Bacteroidales bacterium]|nr:YgjV family protein [Bacteroidales bacterium]